MGDGPWHKGLWRMVDDTLRSVSDTARKIVRTLRLLRAFLVIAVLVVLASAVVGILWPAYWAYAYAAATVFLVVPLVILLVLVALPLQAKSIVRLVDMGYPKNARELAIRVAARKLHEQSIETEELLLETAVNESRKLLKRYRQRAERLKEKLDEESDEAGRGQTP